MGASSKNRHKLILNEKCPQHNHPHTFKKAMGILQSPWSILSPRFFKQVAQCAMIAHLVASIMFGDTIIYDAQRQVTLNLKQ